MRLQWFWHSSFEGLMESVGKFVTDHPDITIAATDWKCVPLENGVPRWYFTMFYR